MSHVYVRRKRSFTHVDNEPMDDPSISFKAKGLLTYCVGRPPGWRIRVSHLAKVSTEGRDAIYSAFKELESAGYCRRIQRKTGEGKFETIDYEVFDVKESLLLPVNPYTENPQNKGVSENEQKSSEVFAENPQKPLTGFPDTANPTLVIKSINKKEREGEAPPLPQHESFLDHGDHVKLKPSSYQRLCERYTKAVIDTAIEEMNDYISANNKPPYGNYEAALKRWLNNDFKSKSKTGMPQIRVATAQKLAKRVVDAFPLNKDIRLHPDALEFVLGASGSIYIKFEDFGFADQVRSRLRKMNLSLPEDLP